MGRKTQEAKSKVSRRRKFTGETTHSFGVRVPASVKAHLERDGFSASSAAQDAIIFEKELFDLLQPVMLELRYLSAARGKDYGLHKAELLAELVKVGLAAAKKAKHTGRT